MSDRVRSILPSTQPWTVRDFADGEPFVGLYDRSGQEVGFAWVSAEDADAVPAQAIRRTRSQVHADLLAIAGVMSELANVRLAAPAVAFSPRPWQVVKGEGYRGAPVTSIFDAEGWEVLCGPYTAPLRIAYRIAVERINRRRVVGVG